MIPRDLTQLSWNELHALRNRFIKHRARRLLLNQPYDHIDVQLRIVEKHITNFNQPPYIKRRIL